MSLKSILVFRVRAAINCIRLGQSISTVILSDLEFHKTFLSTLSTSDVHFIKTSRLGAFSIANSISCCRG